MLTKKRWKSVLAIAIIGLTGSLYSCGIQEQPRMLVSSDSQAAVPYDTEEDKQTKPEQTEALSDVYVYVCGAVKKPDVYKMSVGARIIDAVNAAGGCLEDAFVQSLNLAQEVFDGEKVYVPFIGETVMSEDEEASAKGDGRININKASADELMALPGIGSTKAAQITAYRDKNGDFKAIEDLMLVPGIKAGVFEPIADLITVD